MNRDRIEELAVGYSTGELNGQELSEFKAWRSTATAEELVWFASIVDGAGEIAHKPHACGGTSPRVEGEDHGAARA